VSKPDLPAARFPVSSTLRMSSCTRMILAAVLVASAMGSAATAAVALSEERDVKGCVGVHASDGIKVHASVGEQASLSLQGDGEALKRVISLVDFWGTLTLSLPGGGADVEANVTTLRPLIFAAVSAGGILNADAVAGTVLAFSSGHIDIKNLTNDMPTSISSSSNSAVSIHNGKLGFVAVSCTDHASMRLHDLQADWGAVSVSYRASLKGMTVGAVALSVSNASSVDITATRQVGLLCSDSGVTLSGGPDVSTLSNSNCSIDRKDSSLQAAFYP